MRPFADYADSPQNNCRWRWDRADKAKPGQLLTTTFNDALRRMNDPYGVQNVLVAQLDFDIWGAPARGEWAVLVYSDRLQYGQIREIHVRHGGKGDWLDGLSSWSKGNLLQFVEDVCGLEWCGSHSGVIGFRIMRHTKVSNGYPLYTIEAHGKVAA